VPKTGGRSRLGLIIAAVVILAGFAYLVTGGISSNLVFFLTPGELLAKGTDAYDTPIRLGGQVAPNSVKWDAEALDLRFTLQDAEGKQVEVHARKAPPQMFR
jgi:cytochrome c-type biogenesis protein CcmE